MRMTVTLVTDVEHSTVAMIETPDASDVPGPATHEDAVIEASSATPVREILTRLGDLVGVASDAVAKIDGHTVDDGRAMSPLGGALREGAIVSFDTTRRHPTQNEAQSSYLELRVVGGPAAGSIHLLAVGITPIGRDRVARNV